MGAPVMLVIQRGVNSGVSCLKAACYILSTASKLGEGGTRFKMLELPGQQSSWRCFERGHPELSVEAETVENVAVAT